MYYCFKLPVYRQREDSVNAIKDCLFSLNVWLQVFLIYCSYDDGYKIS